MSFFHFLIVKTSIFTLRLLTSLSSRFQFYYFVRAWLHFLSSLANPRGNYPAYWYLMWVTTTALVQHHWEQRLGKCQTHQGKLQKLCYIHVFLSETTEIVQTAPWLCEGRVSLGLWARLPRELQGHRPLPPEMSPAPLCCLSALSGGFTGPRGPRFPNLNRLIRLSNTTIKQKARNIFFKKIQIQALHN